MTQGLRERQKAKRRAGILQSARKKFQEEGFANVTVEDIAQAADVSAVTVYNYFGSKAGILLSLVSDSDELLIQKLRAFIADFEGDLIEAVLQFGRILRRHAMSYLSKPTWREVLGASIHEGSRDFGRTYAELDNVLIDLMAGLVRQMQERGALSREVDVAALANCLFAIQNIRFFQFISDDDVSVEETDARLEADLTALKMVFSLPPTEVVVQSSGVAS